MRRAGNWLLANCILVVLLAVLLGENLLAQNAPVHRPYESLILTGRSFPEFSGDRVPVDELFLYSYDALSQTWQQVPFQIDQVDTAGSFFGNEDGLLDDNDQLVFMALDAGDRAPFNDWIENAEARQNSRFEIKLADPLDPASESYLYLYRSTTLIRDGSKSYMRYAPAPEKSSASDTVFGRNYSQAHNANNGLPDYLAIPSSQGGNGTDILDRLKLRIQVPFAFLKLTINEDSLKVDSLNLSIKAGPVRIVRKANITVNFRPLFSDSVEVVSKFYPFSMIISGKLAFTEIHPSLLRVSLDLNNNASGMMFINQNNAQITIDGQNDIINKSIVSEPEINWDMITGTQGTIVKIIRLNLDSLSAAKDSLYYWDSASGGSMDGTNDTGDMASFGDTGILIENNSISGIFPIFIESFFLPGNQDRQTGIALRDQVAKPLQAIKTLQNFDAIPPAQIADLKVTNATDYTLTLEWTAPGDDSLGSGPATSYTLYFSSDPVGSDTLAWLQNATTLNQELPVPATPGTKQQFTLTGLQPQMTYYVILIAMDDFGNASPYSNIAFKQTTLPVRLTSFTSQVYENEVHLSWKTAFEANNFGFAIERRTGNPGDWDEIGFVKGRGTTNQAKSYQYVDRVNSPGRYFYRLRQTDVQGEVVYSPEVQVQVAVPATANLSQSYPNPLRVGQRASMRYSLPVRKNNQVSLRVYNILGQDLGAIFSGSQNAGYYELSWDGRLATGNRIAPGIYFLVLETNRQRVIRKFTVLPF